MRTAAGMFFVFLIFLLPFMAVAGSGYMISENGHLQGDLNETSGQVTSLSEQNGQITNDLAAAQNQINSLQAQLSAAQKSADDERVAKEQALLAIQQLQVHINNLSQQVGQLQKDQEVGQIIKDQAIARLQVLEGTNQQLQGQLVVAITERDAARNTAAALQVEMQAMHTPVGIRILTLLEKQPAYLLVLNLAVTLAGLLILAAAGFAAYRLLYQQRAPILSHNSHNGHSPRPARDGEVWIRMSREQAIHYAHDGRSKN